MSDDRLVRVKNLKALRLSAAELSARVGSQVSYWHGLMSGDRPFGEKVARKIEDKLGLPRGQLDGLADHPVVPAPAAAASSAKAEHWRAVAFAAATHLDAQGQVVRPLKFLQLIDLLAEHVAPDDTAEDANQKIVQHLRLVA